MTTFGRVNLHLSAGHTLAQRGAMRRQMVNALGYADLEPRGLPPQAILIVRQLQDPAPGVLLKGDAWQAGNRWGDGARGKVDRLWRSAARPAQGSVPANAEAVWFGDMAEWLACLSLDLYHGLAHLRWWWHMRLNTPALRQSPAPLAAVWQAEAQWLPAALATLHEQSSIPVTELVSRLSANERQQLRRTILLVHSLPQSLDRSLAAETWRQWIPNPQKIGSDLAKTEATAALLLAIHYAPAKLRQTVHNPSAAGSAAGVSSVGAAHKGTLPLAPPTTERASNDYPDSRPVATGQAGTPTVTDKPAIERRTSAKTKPAEPTDSSVNGQFRTAPVNAKDSAAAAQEAPPPAVLESASSKTLSKPAFKDVAPVLDRPEGLATTLGGAWFLINLLILLDLLDDGPFEPPPWVSPWLKLELLAQRMLAEPADDDPLWAVLAALSGPECTPESLEQAAAWLSETWPQIEIWLLDHLDGGLDLTRPARLFVSRTHIDVVFSIEEIKLSLRLVGLDRDPGWVPELARVIAFHFE